ncbi:MAG: TonB-dependent receptor plug domain-containing protein [Saprospiraceae bacterium]|nr:TonB-dependent receptor plug domain-containing protein [Saprospiraceae bacterium]
MKQVFQVLSLLSCLLWIGCASSNYSPRNASSEMIDQGYGTQKESSRTTAISSQKISRQDETLTMADLLSRAPGVSVTGQGRNLTVRIRGRKSIISNNDPLFVVNGQIMGTGFQSVNFIDPFMIDNISVLKDAAASSQYGHRGANGVVLINLKKF